MIHHLADAAAWEAARASGTYRAASLDTEGFIHLSTTAQWPATRERYYAGVGGLVLLDVDDAHPAVASALRWERSTGDELFPHLYGSLPCDAVVAVHALAVHEPAVTESD